MSPITELRNTRKGQLKYSPCLDTNKLKLQLDELSPPPLSRFHEEKESSKQNLSFGLDSTAFDSSLTTQSDINNCALLINMTPRIDDITDCTFKKEYMQLISEKTSDDNQTVVDIFESLPSPDGHRMGDKIIIERNTSFPISPEIGYTPSAIVDANCQWEQETQLSLMKRLAEFEDHDRCLNYLMDNKEKEILTRLSQQANHRQFLIDKKLQHGMEEGHKRRQRLKEDHEEHQKKINIKNMEIERKIELFKEEARKRKDKISKLHALWKDIDNNRQSYIQQQDACKFSSSLPDIANKNRTDLEKICACLSAQLQSTENLPNVDEMLTKFEEERKKSSDYLTVLEKIIEETQERVIAEEKKQKEEEKSKAEKVEAVKKQQEALAQDLTVQSYSYVLKEYEIKSKLLTQVETTIRPFVDNAQNKSFRFSIQRAVNTPINAISDYSGPHLMDKLKKLKDLLNGQIGSLSGNPTPGNVQPYVLLFCQNLIAKMLVKKGEEQVTSKHESAFPIGTVVVALWEAFPVIGELFLAHLQALCPYTLPMYPPRRDEQSSIDYHKSLGYKVSEDGTIEEQDKFLRRMSGLMRLYCSCMVAHLPPGVSSPHPHWLEHAWMWLARTMNLDPLPDVTAAMIYDVLSVTGHALFREYRVQFAKLLYLLHKHYLPKLESVSVTNAAIGRLKIFVETAMKNVNIPPPEGLLSANFFFKPPDPM